MAERLAKKKAAKDRQSIIDSFQGGLSYGKSGVDITPQLSQLGNMAKGLALTAPATVMDIVSGIVRPLDKYVGGVKDPVDQYRPEDAGTSNLISGGGQALEQATRRAVGDITAIPRVGKPSASPTATDIRRLGVIEGLSKAGIDYTNLALTAAPFIKPSMWSVGNKYNDMLQARIAKANNPYRFTGDFIDAVEGSRLPARIVDTPATPATRLAEAQAAREIMPVQVAPTSNEIRNSIQRFIDGVEQRTGTITKQTPPTALPVPGNKFTIEPFVPTNQTTWKQGSRWTHYTTPEEAKNLLKNGILATSEKEGTNLGRVKGLPPGTFFAGQEGGPFMEYMATQYQEFVNPNNMTKVAVNIPQDAKILGLTSEAWATQELREQNFTPEQQQIWEQYLAKATAEHRFGDSFQVAATNFAKDMGFDAVRMDQQIAILPQQTTLSTPYITPYITPIPTSPATRLAEAQTQRALMPAAQRALHLVPTPTKLGSQDALAIPDPIVELTTPKNNVTNLNQHRAKTGQYDPRWKHKDMRGFLQDDNFQPITNGFDQIKYDSVWLAWSPPGAKSLLEKMGFKPYNKENMLGKKYKGLIPAYNDEFYLEINKDYDNGMGNYIDVYRRPPLWDFVDNEQLQYLGQAYGSHTTRTLLKFFNKNPSTPLTPITQLAKAKATPTPEMTAQLQRQTARTELGVNIQDIEFPSPGNELTRPAILDSSDYGVFPHGAWGILGQEQHAAGINNATMPQEMRALRSYFSHDYDLFQSILRNDGDDYTHVTRIFNRKIEQIDNIFKVTSPTTENFKVFRGVKADGNMPDGPFVGAFYRSLKEGDFIVEPAYMSTSISYTVANEWADSHPDDYLLIIHAPKGSVAVHPIVSWEQGIKEMKTHLNAPSEQELLFNRGTVLKILSNDMGVIEAEMVLPHQTPINPMSTSGIKESLLKQYSYKDLAEMVADEQSKADFLVEHFQTLPDLQKFLSVNKSLNQEYALANTIYTLNQEYYESIHPYDYWKFRDIVDEIVVASEKPTTTKNRYAVAKELLSLLDKHRLLYDGTTEFIRNNLDDILKIPS